MRGIKEEAKVRALDARIDRSDRERQRLRAENEALRDRLQAADEERGRWLETIEGLSRRDSRRGRPHRVRRSVVLLGTAGSAYVMGTKAGRTRYEQIRSWWRDLRSRASSGEVEPSSSVAAPTA
ncbi:MAG TPA: hypothetical protein VE669_02960 [Actinomycetota bacterium]|jgi:chromosome segregation ATPase|nr:hypothetical protein [Actinomycetota bacterium]